MAGEPGKGICWQLLREGTVSASQRQLCSPGSSWLLLSELLLLPWGMHGSLGHTKTCLSTSSGCQEWHLLSSTRRCSLVATE